METNVMGRCKHGMILRYCSMCREIRYEDDYCFPIPSKEDPSKLIWIRGTTIRSYYRCPMHLIKYNR